MSDWILIKDKIPDVDFYWKDDVSGQTGFGCFDSLNRPSFLSSGGIRPWFFENWDSITCWKPVNKKEKE